MCIGKIVSLHCYISARGVPTFHSTHLSGKTSCARRNDDWTQGWNATKTSAHISCNRTNTGCCTASVIWYVCKYSQHFSCYKVITAQLTQYSYWHLLGYNTVSPGGHLLTFHSSITGSAISIKWCHNLTLHSDFIVLSRKWGRTDINTNCAQPQLSLHEKAHHEHTIYYALM